MIKFNNVTKVFNNTLKAVDDLSFTVNKGEIVGFIGPNGSGKTTTIKMLTGILSSDSGEISINGHDIKKEPLEAKKSIGYIADSPDMFLRLKGIEFLNFIGDIYKVPSDVRKKRFTEVCDRFGLTDSLNAPRTVCVRKLWLPPHLCTIPMYGFLTNRSSVLTLRVLLN